MAKKFKLKKFSEFYFQDNKLIIELALKKKRFKKIEKIEVKILEDDENDKVKKTKYIYQKEADFSYEEELKNFYKEISGENYDKEIKNKEEMQEMKEKIKRFFFREKKNALDNKDEEIKALAERKIQLRKEIEDLKENFQQESQKQKEELETQKRNFELILKEHEASLNFYKEEVRKQKSELEKLAKFKKLSEILELYNSLNPQNKENLKNTLNAKNEKTFLLSGANKNNISVLFDYIKNLIIDEKMQDIEKLKEIYFYLFDEFNEANNNIYELQNVELDSRFDSEEYSKVGKASGRIEKLLLQGYIDKRSQKILNKSLVKVK